MDKELYKMMDELKLDNNTVGFRLTDVEIKLRTCTEGPGIKSRVRDCECILLTSQILG